MSFISTSLTTNSFHLTVGAVSAAFQRKHLLSRKSRPYISAATRYSSMPTEDLSSGAGITLSADPLSEQWILDHYEMSSSTLMKSVQWIIAIRMYSCNCLNLPAKFVQCNFFMPSFFPFPLTDLSFTSSDCSVDSLTQYNLTVIFFFLSNPCTPPRRIPRFRRALDRLPRRMRTD
jgi:hypothetical protein